MEDEEAAGRVVERGLAREACWRGGGGYFLIVNKLHYLLI